MKKYFLMAVLISLVLIVDLSIADGSLTITSQVLDSKVRPGGETTVFLTLTNPSTTTAVRAIKLFISPGPYIIPSFSYAEIGGLDTKASQQTSLTVKISSTATSMTSYITVKATYYTDSVRQESSVNVPIIIRRIPTLQVEEVKFIPSLTGPGDKVNFTFNLKNEGDGPAKNVKVVLNQTPQRLIVEGAPETFIDVIEPKESKALSFNIIVDPSVAIGTYSIPISLMYLDETKTENYSTTKYVGLVVSGKYDFIITVTQDILVPGGTGDVNLEIANGGTQEARYVTVKILLTDPIVQATPSLIYIGNLKPDDYETQKFKIGINRDVTPGTYPLEIQLRYKDPYGKMYNETYKVDIVVSTTLREFAPSNGPKLSPVSIIIIIIALGTIVYFVYRRFKKKR